MCGIFAYLNYKVPQSRRAILKKVLHGLKTLEYRGCDSSGLAIDDDGFKEGVPVLYRAVGLVASLEKQVQERSRETNLDRIFDVHAAVAHTRWASCGGPSETNAHPQPSNQDNSFVIVHNGIITNQGALRTFLESRGFSFSSETDTEVIAKMCEYFWMKPKQQYTFAELVAQVVSPGFAWWAHRWLRSPEPGTVQIFSRMLCSGLSVGEIGTAGAPGTNRRCERRTECTKNVVTHDLCPQERDPARVGVQNS